MLSLELLGPPLLRLDGRVLALMVKKTWALVLAVACAGRSSRARLADLLWPSLDEPTARRNLRRELARLREAGADGLLRTEGDWIVLHEGVAVDVARFEAAVRAGDGAQALSLWRGPLADGLSLDDAPAFDRWLDDERNRLRALWRAALEAAAEGARPEQALALWLTLLADDPLQEQHHRAVMRLHAAAGRREAALAQYTRLLALLRDELGLAPVAETEALVQSLRGAGPVAPPVAPASRVDALLRGQLPFVGRAAEVAAMEAAWRAGRSMLIEGEGGIGKTRLVLDFVAAHGAYALARCRSGDQEVPYAAWTRALRALAGSQPTRASLGSLPAWACDEMARLLPEFSASGERAAPIASDEERSRFFEANALAWQALSADDFDAVVLDDWHHADAASLAMLAFVVQRRAEPPGRGAREIVLLRPEIDGVAAGAWQSLRGGGALHLVLQPLPREEVHELVRRLSGASDPARFAGRLQRATGGNPFFLSETLRHLVESGLVAAGDDGVWRTPFDDATQDYHELPVPASVREAVLARVQRLGDASRRVLEASALAAEPFAPALLAPACALSEVDVVLAIEQAVQAQLLREHEAGGFGFVHDLVQQALDGALTSERRRLVHRRLALGAEAARAPPAQVAAHHEASGDLRRAVAHRLAAAEQAQALHALPEAMTHWQKALADGAVGRQALRAHQGLMAAARLRCEVDAMLGHIEALQRMADDTTPEAAIDGGAAVLTSDERAEALVSIAENLIFDNRAAQGLEVLDRLPSALAEPVQVQASLMRARALHGLGRIDETRATVQAALALRGLPGAVQGQLLDLLTLTEIAAGDMPAARVQVQASLALGRRLGDDELVALAQQRCGMTWLVEGELVQAEADLLQAADSFASRGSVYRQRGTLFNLCVLYENQCRHDLALAAARRGWALQPPLPPGDLRLMYHLAFVDSHVALGDLGEAWAHAQQAIAAVLAMNEPQPLMAATHCTLELLGLLGEIGLARQLLAAAERLATSELAYASAEYWIATAQFELAAGDAAAARRALASAPAAADVVDVRVRVRHALAAAELQLAEGDAAGALALLPADDAEGINDEMRCRALALALRAQAAAGGVQSTTREAARAALERPSPYAPATLQLHRAMGLLSRAEYVGMLARSLDALPQQQAAFLRRAGD